MLVAEVVMLVFNLLGVKHAIRTKFWLCLGQINDVTTSWIPAPPAYWLFVHRYSAFMILQKVLQIASANVPASASDPPTVSTVSQSAGSLHASTAHCPDGRWCIEINKPFSLATSHRLIASSSFQGHRGMSDITSEV